MFTAIVWKEWRQQAAIVVAILVLAGIAVGSIMLFMPAEWANRQRDAWLMGSLMCVIVALVITQGVVTGALLFAGESEDRTQEFLDVHAGRRFPVWRAKIVAGVSIVCVSSIALGGMIAAAQVSNLWWVALALWFALDALVWAALASSLRPTTFGAIGVGLIFLVVVAGLPLHLLNTPSWPFYFLVKGPLMAVAVALSWRAYCASDPWRANRRSTGETISRQPGWVRVALWRFWAGQKRTMVLLGMFAIGVIFEPGWPPAFVWPTVTFLVGCIAGWSVFADETRDASERFLGDRRLPLGRVWLGKVVPLLAMAMLACLAVLVPLLLRQLARHAAGGVPFDHFSELFGFPLSLELAATFVFVAYGFAVALVLSQHAGKMPVAIFLTIALGGVTAALWYPSLFRGMPAWRMAVVPVVLLIASWRGMRRWTSGRLHDRGGLAWLAATSLALVLWLAGNLWWRVHEIPDVGEPFDTKATWTDLINTPDTNGAELRLANNEATRRLDQAIADWVSKNPAQDDDLWRGGFFAQADDPEHREKSVAFQAVLDDVFAGDWVAPFQRAALSPPDRFLTIAELQNWSHQPGELTGENLFVVRALSRARAGDVDGTIHDFDVALSATRHALHRTNGTSASRAIGLNITILKAIERTFDEPIFAAPAYRAKLAALLAKHDEAMPNFAGIVTSMWRLGDRPQSSEEDRIRRLIDSPWERARLERQRRSLVMTMLAEAKNDRFPPPWWDLPSRDAERIKRTLPADFWMWLEHQRDGYAGGVELVRGLRLAVAASEFASAHGRSPRSLAELTPGLLPRLPESAYIGGSFRLIEADRAERTRVVALFRHDLKMAIGQGVIVDDVTPSFAVVVPK